MSTSPSESPDFDSQRELFDRAMDLPSAERQAFVRREAGDDQALCAAVLRLIANAESDKLLSGAGARTAGSRPIQIGPYIAAVELLTAVRPQSLWQSSPDS